MDWLPYLIHFANIMYLTSYLVRDILWLRLFTIVAGSSLVFYFLWKTPTIWEAVIWNVVFILINVVQSVILIRERQPVELSQEEEELYLRVFRSLTPREFKGLLKSARWVDTGDRHVVTKEGEEIHDLCVIVNGEASVRKKGSEVARLTAGHFVGEMAFLSGDPTSAEVVTDGPARLVIWPFHTLRDVLEKKTNLRSALQYAIGEDLVQKLRAT